MKTYLKNWDLMRVIRLALGIFIIVQGIAAREWLFMGMGTLLALMPLLNIGCCSASGCSTNISKNDKDPGNVSYEEVQ